MKFEAGEAVQVGGVHGGSLQCEGGFGRSERARDGGVAGRYQNDGDFEAPLAGRDRDGFPRGTARVPRQDDAVDPDADAQARVRGHPNGRFIDFEVRQALFAKFHEIEAEGEQQAIPLGAPGVDQQTGRNRRQVHTPARGIKNDEARGEEIEGIHDFDLFGTAVSNLDGELNAFNGTLNGVDVQGDRAFRQRSFGDGRSRRLVQFDGYVSVHGQDRSVERGVG